MKSSSLKTKFYPNEVMPESLTIKTTTNRKIANNNLLPLAIVKNTTP